MKTMLPVAIIVCILLIAVALRYLARRPMRVIHTRSTINLQSKWVGMVRQDEQGNPVGRTQWVRAPKLERIARNGLEHVGIYVARMAASKAPRSSLIIYRPDGQSSLLLQHYDHHFHFNMRVEWREKPEEEEAIRSFFQQRSISPTEDFLAGNGDVPDARRILNYSLPENTQDVSDLSVQILQRIYRINEQEALGFSFQEHRE